MIVLFGVFCVVRGWELKLMWIGKENQPVRRDLNKMDTIPEIRIMEKTGWLGPKQIKYKKEKWNHSHKQVDCPWHIIYQGVDMGQKQSFILVIEELAEETIATFQATLRNAGRVGSWMVAKVV